MTTGTNYFTGSAALLALCYSGSVAAAPGDAPSHDVYARASDYASSNDERFNNALTTEKSSIGAIATSAGGYATANTNTDDATIKLYAHAEKYGVASASGTIRDTLKFKADLTRPHDGLWADFLFRFHHESSASTIIDEEGKEKYEGQLTVFSGFRYWLPGDEYENLVDFSYTLITDLETGEIRPVGGYGYSQTPSDTGIGSFERVDEDYYKARFYFPGSFAALPFEYFASIEAYNGATVDFTHTASLQIQVPDGVTISSESGTFGSSWLGSPTAVPEPSTWATMLLGFGLIGAAVRRRRTFVAA